MRAALVAFVVAVALPITAAAESQPTCPRGQTCTVYDRFDTEDVRARPGEGPGDQIRAGLPGPRPSLLRVRTDFVPELLKSVEQL